MSTTNATVWITTLAMESLTSMQSMANDVLATYLPTPFPYFEAVLGFMWLVYAWETYLTYRQYKRIHVHTTRPALLAEKGIVTAEQYVASRAYNLDKSGFAMVNATVSQVETTLLLFYGFLPFMWRWCEGALAQLALWAGVTAWVQEDAVLAEILQSLLFVFSMSIYSTVVHLPLGIYSTFVIEARHGFNRLTPWLYFMDTIKGIMLSMVVGLPVTAASLWVMLKTGEYFYLYLYGLVVLVQFLGLTLYPVLIQPLFNNYTPVPDGPLKEQIEAVAKRVKFPMTKLFIVDGSKRSSHSNAYFFGFFNKRIVLYDTLLEQCGKTNHGADEDAKQDMQARDAQVTAILGHEIGHWALNHTTQMMLIGQVHMFLVFFLFGQFLNNEALFHAFGFDLEADTGKLPVLISFMLFQTLYAPVDHFIGFMMNLFSRRNEFQADAYSASLGYKGPLKEALICCQVANMSNFNPDPWYSTYHHAHPPLLARLEAIDALEDKDEKKNN